MGGQCNNDQSVITFSADGSLSDTPCVVYDVIVLGDSMRFYLITNYALL